MLYKIGILKNVVKFSEYPILMKFLLNKVAGFWPEAVLAETPPKKTLEKTPVNFVNFLKTPRDDCHCSV